MKTLDEVINALEICGHDESPKCPYFDTEHWCCCEDHMRSISPLKNDALHYLKHLQEYYEMSREHHESNPALTWDELKTMVGKPVWVEWISGTWKGLHKWILIRRIEDLIMEFTALDVARVSYDGNLQKYCLGKTWQAYRKEKL